MNKKIICITGANGFIGKHLVEKLLLSSNNEIRVLSRSSNDDCYLLNRISKLSYYYADLADKNLSVDLFLRDCDVLINCAAELKNINLMQSVNVDAVNKLIFACEKELQRDLRINKNIHLVQISSIGVYGATSHILRKVIETSPLNPMGEYEKSKAEADILIENIGFERKLKWTIIRPSNVIGIGMHTSYLKALISSVKKNYFFFIGSKLSVATYIAIDDVVDLIILCTRDERSMCQIFNISNDNKLNTVINQISTSLGKSKVKIRIPRFLVINISSFINIFFKTPLSKNRISSLSSCTTYPVDKLREKLNFRPKQDILELIDNIIKYEYYSK